MKKLITVLLLTIMVLSAEAQTTSTGFTVENYYKLRWGYADEFISLWKKNHYPLLKKLLESGDLLSIKAETPLLHSSEDSRWDFKVIMVFKNEHAGLDYSLVDPFKKQLFPDQENYKKAEQHRFELVLAHWDVLVEPVVLN